MIILNPSHAFVGVRLLPGSKETLFIETTMVGRSVLESIGTLTNTFDAAVKRGYEKYSQVLSNNPSELRIVDVKRAREMGIYPLKSMGGN